MLSPEEILMDGISARGASILQSKLPAIEREYAEALAGLIMIETMTMHQEYSRNIAPACEIVKFNRETT